MTNPILIDDGNGIVAGRGRLEAVKSIGMDQVPTVRLSAMSEADVRACVIADSRLAENAGWDRNLLDVEIQYLTELDIAFNVTLTGFDMPEIEILIGELLSATHEDPADEPVDVAAGPAITQFGDRCRLDYIV